MSIYICPKCNSVVTDPQQGSGFKRFARFCPRGHTTRKPGSFVGGLVLGFVLPFLVIAFVIGVDLLSGSTDTPAWMIPGIPLAGVVIAGVGSLIQGLKYRNNAGPVHQLAPTQLGIGIGIFCAMLVSWIVRAVQH